MVSNGPMQRVVPYVFVVRHLGCTSLWCLPANGTKQKIDVYTNLICVTKLFCVTELIPFLELSV
jgi:hypothetical protein